MARLTDSMAVALRTLRQARARDEASAVAGDMRFGPNLWNRLYGAGLVGRTAARSSSGAAAHSKASGARLWWITREGEAALDAYDARAVGAPGAPA